MEGWIVLMFAVVFGGPAVWGITDTVLKHRRKMATIKYGRSDREAQLASDKAELKETVAMLNKRLAVLETIATDPAKRVADEIDGLR